MIKSINNFKAFYLPYIPLIGACVYLVLSILSHCGVFPFSSAHWYDLEAASLALFITACLMKLLTSTLSPPSGKTKKTKKKPSKQIREQSVEQRTEPRTEQRVELRIEQSAKPRTESGKGTESRTEQSKPPEEFEQKKKEIIDKLVDDASQDDKLFFALWELLFKTKSHETILHINLPSCLEGRFDRHIKNVSEKDTPGVRCVVDELDYRDLYVLKKLPSEETDLNAYLSANHLQVAFTFV